MFPCQELQRHAEESGVDNGVGQVGFVRPGNVEMDSIEPEDEGQLFPGEGYTLHHVAYLVDDLAGAIADFRARGCAFAKVEPFTNFMGYRLIYFDPSRTSGAPIDLPGHPHSHRCRAVRRYPRRPK